MNTDGGRDQNPAPDGLDRLSKITFAVEAPIRRSVGSGRLNPLPHAGTISSVLLFVVVITGLYITLFFVFGFDASYAAVERLTAHPIQRFMRSLHRYSSAALVVTTLVHAWRVFVAARFNGPRRWRWVTGWTSLVIVWFAGVTGYWLLWDERAQLINEATAAVVGIFNAGERMLSAILTADGSGWQVLFLIWLAHIFTTIAIGYFLWRHLRRDTLPWLPPRLWTGLMIGALILVSIAFPAELLEPANTENIVTRIPFDPFFMFLLPGFGKVPGILVVLAFMAITGFVAYIPWLLDRRKTPIISIDEVACTGCELCVVDCPYKALEMITKDGREVAVVNPQACVSCGICVGSCVFDAITLPGATLPDNLQVEGQDVVIACDRHRRMTNLQGDGLVFVRCVGVLSPTALADVVKAGANSVQVVGCPPADCSFGVGNALAEERLAGERRPRVPKKTAASTTRDFVAPTALEYALSNPGTHLSADPSEVPRSRRRLVTTGAVVLASVLAVGLATTWRFTFDAPESGLTVVVHHQPGSTLAGYEVPSGQPGTPTVLRTVINGEVHERQIGSGGLASAVVTYETEAGDTPVNVTLIEGDDQTELLSGVVTFESNRRIVVTAEDLGPTDAVAGERIFRSNDAGCTVCHSVEPGVELVGPNLANVGGRAEQRVADLSAAEYLRRSIVEPDAYVVEGFPAGQMLSDIADRLTPQEIEALVSYLLTLESDDE